MRLLPALCGLASLASAPAALAQHGVAAPASHAPYSSTATELGTLLHDPAALAVLKKHVPEFLTGPEIGEATWAMTLKEMQAYLHAYKSGVLTDERLAAIDADLAKLPH